LGDGSGYNVRKSDLRFLQIDEQSFVAFRHGFHPLGVDREEWAQFTTSLDLALKNDGISDVDVRLQGSSAHFFSGHHKTMPYAVSDVVRVFMQSRGDREPSEFELDRIMAKLARVWPEGATRPKRRPFDSMYRLTIEKYPSDLDVQISSDEIVDRARARIDRLGLPETDLFVMNEKYSFVRKGLIAAVCPYLTAWAVEQSEILPRPVTVAVFPSAGPPKVPGRLSSHHKAKDWVVRLGADA
jgi:hypothetical protein